MISGNLNQTVTLNIATKPMTEQYIIGAMLKEMIEQDTDIKIKITQELVEELQIFNQAW